MDKILYDIAARATPKVAMTLWNLAPDAVDPPDTLAVVATAAIEEFLMQHGRGIKHLTIFITPDSPQHLPYTIPYFGASLETLDIRTTGKLDCYFLHFLDNIQTLKINARDVSRLMSLPKNLQELRLTIGSSVEIDVSNLHALHTFHLTAERGHIAGPIPESVVNLCIRGPNSRPPDVFPPNLEHLECSGMIMNHVPTLPSTLKTLNLSNTHLEPGQVDFRYLDLDDCCLRGTYLDDDDIQQCRATILDVRWTQITPHVVFHPRVETVYMDTVPTPTSVSSSRNHILVVHIGKEPVHHFPMAIVRRNNRRDATDDLESPFLDHASYVKHVEHRKVECHIWTRTLAIDAVDRLFELSM